MADSRQRTLVSVRASLEKDSHTRVFARSHQAEFGAAFSFDREEPTLTGAENILGLLGAEVLGLFQYLAKQRRLSVDRVEATVQLHMDNSLRFLGVIGAEGSPSFDHFRLKAFVDSLEPIELLNEIWNEALARAPLYNTLGKAASVEVDMEVVT